MKKVIIILFLVYSSNLTTQTHTLGIGTGYSTFDIPIYTNYNFGYKLLNVRTKVVVLPLGLYANSYSMFNDYYIGINTGSEKQNIFSVNIGVSLFFPKYTEYGNDIKQQVNPILNLNYSFVFKNKNRMFTDIDCSQYTRIIDRGGLKPGTSSNKFNLTIVNIQFGFGFSLNKKAKTN